MKTYILKYTVCNNVDFPMGTIVKITDDYWGSGHNSKNTGFTVVEGKLKGQKGCVADGLKGYLIEDTSVNRSLIKGYQIATEKLEQEMDKLDKKWHSVPTVKV